MKSILSLLLLLQALILTDYVSAQKPKNNKEVMQNTQPAEASVNTADNNLTSSYKMALALRDINSATCFAIQMASTPGNENWHDTLLLLYLTQNNYTSAYILSKNLYAAKPGLFYLEALAQSEKNLNLTADALTHYSELAKNTKNIYYIFETAQLEYNMGRLGECITHTEQILTDTSSKHLKTNVSTPQNGYQSVSLMAAALNLRGAIAHTLKDDKTAAQCFNTALKYEPQYAWASANLQSLTSMSNNTTQDTKPVPALKSSPSHK